MSKKAVVSLMLKEPLGRVLVHHVSDQVPTKVAQTADKMSTNAQFVSGSFIRKWLLERRSAARGRNACALGECEAVPTSVMWLTVAAKKTMVLEKLHAPNPETR